MLPWQLHKTRSTAHTQLSQAVGRLDAKGILRRILKVLADFGRGIRFDDIAIDILGQEFGAWVVLRILKRISAHQIVSG